MYVKMQEETGAPAGDPGMPQTDAPQQPGAPEAPAAPADGGAAPQA